MGRSEGAEVTGISTYNGSRVENIKRLDESETSGLATWESTRDTRDKRNRRVDRWKHGRITELGR